MADRVRPVGLAEKTRQGTGDPVVLIAGLSGQGRGWGSQVERFAAGG